MYLRRVVLMGTSLAFVASSTISAPLAYTCDVLRVYALSSKGELETSVSESQMKGSSFSVSRVTGEIIGEVVPTLMADRTRVINPGSSEMSFKALAEFEVVKSVNQVQVLEVQEFMKGAVKPFVAASMGGAGIVTGLCR